MTVSTDREMPPINDQIERLQKGAELLTSPNSWGETSVFGKISCNRCTFTKYPRFFFKALLNGEIEAEDGELEIQRFNDILAAIEKAVEKAQSSDGALGISSAIQKQISPLRLKELTLSHWAFAGELLKNPQEWARSMYEQFRQNPV